MTLSPRLVERMHELKDLEGVLGLLSWDEETYAPDGARLARGQQTGTVEAIKHQRLVDPALGEWIAAAKDDRSLAPRERVMVARLERQRGIAVKVPEALVRAFAEARSASLVAWQQAKKERRFAVMAPALERILGILKERADALGAKSGDRYDALLDEYEPEMTVAELAPVLASLRDGLVPLVDRIAARPRPDTSFLKKGFDEGRQWDFTLRLLRDLGFDLAHGRQDRSSHPFTSAAAPTDVRLTTRIFADNPLSAIFSTIHECGHGLYEQGFAPADHRTPLATAASMGLHESQSRLWENFVGRSRAFWSRYLPVLTEAFPSALGGVSLDAFYRAVNVVERSFIRTESDEVTYNLHILVRFELERPLLSGDLPVSDLPQAWRDKMKAYLGVVPPDDNVGCMQDIHWAWGAVGYFPTYTLGNLYAAQLMAAYEAEHPAVWADVAAARFDPLLAWLRERVHRRGHDASAAEIVKDAVGAPLSVGPFLAYVEKKYGELYSG